MVYFINFFAVYYTTSFLDSEIQPHRQSYFVNLMLTGPFDFPC